MDTKSINVVSKEKEKEFHDDMVIRIRKNVKDMLRERNLTLKEFARQSNLTYTVIHRSLFVIDTITLMTLSRVAIGFGVDIEDLLK